MTQSPPTTLARKTKTSLSSSIRGNVMVLSSWLTTKPFVTSFVEDQRRGTAKETRTNTLLNMDIPKVSSPKDAPSIASSRVESNVSFTSSESFPFVHKQSPTPNRTISFSAKVKVYSRDNPSDPVEEDVKEPSTIPPLEVRRKRAKSSPVDDTRQPVTPVARWLLRKTSKL